MVKYVKPTTWCIEFAIKGEEKAMGAWDIVVDKKEDALNKWISKYKNNPSKLFKKKFWPNRNLKYRGQELSIIRFYQLEKAPKPQHANENINTSNKTIKEIVEEMKSRNAKKLNLKK
tara:strand:- start:904 stop:1254 length:351 start_codon:yes stop_codon:yes gene_type:complete